MRTQHNYKTSAYDHDIDLKLEDFRQKGRLSVRCPESPDLLDEAEYFLNTEIFNFSTSDLDWLINFDGRAEVYIERGVHGGYVIGCILDKQDIRVWFAGPYDDSESPQVPPAPPLPPEESERFTDREKAFAFEHHDIIYSYMRLRHLDFETYYDALVVAYIKAVHDWFWLESAGNRTFTDVTFEALEAAEMERRSPRSVTKKTELVA